MPEGSTPVNGTFWVRRITLFCLAVVVSVGLLDFFFYHLQWFPSEIISRSFDVGREESYGTWISTTLALFAGLAAAGIAMRFWHQSTRWECIGWTIVALFFIFVSFDDAAKFHERMGTALRVKVERATDVELASWFPSWGWQLYVAPLFAAIGLYMCWFFWRAVAPRLRIWVFLGFTLLAVAVGIDFVEGMLDRQDEQVNHLMRLTEEMLEMFGTTAFLYVFLTTLSAHVTLYIAHTGDDNVN